MTTMTTHRTTVATDRTIRRTIRRTPRAGLLAALALAGLATACTISGPAQIGGGPAAAPGQPPVTTRVEGSWAPADGASIATFQNGAFVNRATDTGQPFTAGGRYSYDGGDRVSIAYTSLVRQSQVNVNCLAVSASQLNCTNASGANFSLFRRA